MKERGDSTYAKLKSETIFGIEAWFPRKRRQAFPLDANPGDSSDFYNEMQIWFAARLVNWAFRERALKPMPLRDLLENVHVLSASSHKVNDFSYRWPEEREAAKDDVQWCVHSLVRSQAKMMAEQQKMVGEVAELKGMLAQLLEQRG